MRNDAAGFTLIELMVSMAILALISVYLTGMLTQQNRAYTVVDQVTEAQSNMRAIASILEREIRVTAGLVPEGAAACGVDNTAAPDMLYVTDMDALTLKSDMTYQNGAWIQSGFTGTGTDTIRLYSPSGANPMNLDGENYYDVDADGAADADFRPGGGVIVIDQANPMRGTACGVIVAGGVSTGGSTIDVDFTDSGGTLAAVPPFRPAAVLWAIPAHRYMIDATNQLLRDDLVLADDVEDFQVAWLFDLDDDEIAGEVAANEVLGIPGNQYAANAVNMNHENLREIRFNIVTRSRRPDPSLTGATFQALENRAPIAGTDGFRRRVLTSEVRLRNVGSRWDE
jgi:prepilin-type N-terminal cleavage/methylation domain-containing protein